MTVVGERRSSDPAPYDGPERRARDSYASEAATLNGAIPAWLRAAVLLGVPSVIALWLVYVLTNAYPARFARIDDALARIERRLVQTCVVAAATDEDRSQCFAP